MLLDDDLSLLAYTSVACHHMSHQELITLLTHCRQKNSTRNISGMLLYMNGCFFQVLEGPRTQLELLFEKISNDKRHHHVMKLIVEPIKERAFENWSMGFKDITAAELASITGLTDFLNHEDRGFMGIESTRAKQLIQTFRDGRWLRNDLTQYSIINMST